MAERRGKGGTSRSRNQGWWTKEVVQLPSGLKHLYGQKKKAARSAVDRARRSVEEELYRKLEKTVAKR